VKKVEKPAAGTTEKTKKEKKKVEVFYNGRNYVGVAKKHLDAR
jgi:hypothetical protein